MDYVLPLLFVATLWWVATIVLLYRTGLDKASYGRTMVAAGIAAAIGFYVVVATRNDATPGVAYIAFAGALAIWAFHETSYLLGFVSGPRPQGCPPSATMWQRFLYGIKTCLYHELAVVATVGALVAVTWDAANRIALWTFVIVWIMRWSAKLNIFLGVRNLHREYWPEHLRYLQSYARERSMNPLFPWSVVIALGFIGFLLLMAVGADSDSAQRTSAMLLGGFLILALLEHFFLMFRLPDDLLWRLGTRARDS